MKEIDNLKFNVAVQFRVWVFGVFQQVTPEDRFLGINPFTFFNTAIHD